MQDASAAGGSPPWRHDLDPQLRPRVLDKIVRKLAQVYHGQFNSREDLNKVASSFENRVFHEANSKGDYLRIISLRLVGLEQKHKQRLLQHAASGHHKQIQTGSDTGPVHAMHGSNSSTTAMSQETSMMSTHARQSSQVQSLPMTPLGSGLVRNQKVSYPSASNMSVNVKQKQPEVTRKPEQILNSRHASITISPVAPGQKMVQSIASQELKQLALRMQPTNTSGGNLISIAHPQRQLLHQRNVEQNPLKKNARRISMPPKERMTVNQNCLGFNQQQDRQKYEMPVPQQVNLTKTHNGHPGAQNSQSGITVGLHSVLKMHEQQALNEDIKMESQPVALPQPQITISQQNKTTGRDGEVDWREEMFQQIKPLKDAHLSELMELDQAVHVPKLTEKQLESLPKDKAEQYRFRVNLKKRTTLMLNFLLLEKSNIPGNYRGQFSRFLKSINDLLGYYKRSKNRMMDARDKSHIAHGQGQSINLSSDKAPSGGRASHLKHQEHLVHTQLREKENTITTTSAAQDMNHNCLLGVGSSCFPEKSRGPLQSLPIDKVQECCTRTPSLVIDSGLLNVSSPSASLKSTSSSLDAMRGAAKAAASSASVKSALTLPVTRQGVVKVASPYASVKSTLPSAIAESASIQAATPCASIKSTLPSPFASSALSITNSGCTPFALPCPSMHPTSSENVESCYAMLLQDNSAAAAAAAAQAVLGGTTTKAANGSKQVTTAKPIMPASPLQALTADNQAEDIEHDGNEILVAKKPIDRLLDALRTSSPKVLGSAAKSIESILNMNDWVPPRGIDAFQDYYWQCGSNTVNKRKCIFDSTSLCSEPAPPGSMDGSCMSLDWTISEAEYSAECSSKRQKVQNPKDTLLEEINSANIMLLDTFISMADDNETDGIVSSNGGTLIKLCYTAISLAPDLESLFATSGMSIVMSVKFLVPADYPRSSPVIVCDQRDEQIRRRFSEISGAADVAFRHTLYGLSEPMSVLDMARAWDASVRRVIVEFAQQHGGGTFSSRYGEWTRC